MIPTEPKYCKANELTEFLGNRDLDPDYEKGFTIGKKGKVMYWYFWWHKSSGNASIFTTDNPMKRRWIKGDQLIKVHFKQHHDFAFG